MEIRRGQSFFRLTSWLAAGFSAWALASCGANEPQEKSCTELGAALAADSGTAAPAFRVIRPNGGEIFHVGDSMHVRVTGNLDQSNATVRLMVGPPGGIRSDLVPGLTGSRNVYQNCDLAFVIPDSLGASRIPMVSNSVQLRVQDYNAGNFYFDVSDGYFQILP